MWFFKNYWILWQNARNLNYINEYNDKFAKKLADSKLKTKEFLSKKWVSVSESLYIIKNHKELDTIDFSSFEFPFVVKPNAGYWGKGILIFERKDSHWNFVTNDHQSYTLSEFKTHIWDILDGFYSLSWTRDKVIFEKKIVLDHSIELLGKYGLPDIRVIVFNSIPVIAMLRVPTQNSKGKANLHAWACWVGIDIWSGKLTYITQFKKMIKSIPWIGDVRNIELPKWEEILKLAVKVQQITNIWYVGCDIVLDENVGPLLLEMNVRPWLEVQVANKVPLLERLKKVENIKVHSIEKWVRLARDLFGWEIEEKIKNISWKKVLGTKEYTKIFIEENIYKTIAEIKINKNTSYIDKRYLLDILKYDESKIKNDTVKLKCDLLWEKQNIRFQVKDLEKSHILYGKDILHGFLIDPFKYKDQDLPIDSSPIVVKKNVAILKWYEDQLIKIDKALVEVDKKLNILKFITPNNIQTEKVKFVNALWDYIPKFQYNEIPLDLDVLYSEVDKIEVPDITLSGIFSRKKEEVLNKITFLIAFQKQNTKELTILWQKLYGKVIKNNLEYAVNMIHNKSILEDEKEFLTISEMVDYVNKFNHIYSLKIMVKEKEIGSRFAIKWNTLYIKHGALVGKREMRSVIAHEIEGHYLRKVNAFPSRYSIFSYGTSWYLPIDEWIAIYNQSRFLTHTDSKYYWLFERYYFIDYALKHSYKELLKEYKEYYENDYAKIFNYLVRLKRWLVSPEKDGCFVKDVVYLNGYIDVTNYIEWGGDIRELYFWKNWITTNQSWDPFIRDYPRNGFSVMGWSEQETCSNHPDGK